MADELFSLVEKYTSVESMVESFVESSYLKLMEVMAKKRINSWFLWYVPVCGSFLKLLQKNNKKTYLLHKICSKFFEFFTKVIQEDRVSVNYILLKRNH